MGFAGGQIPVKDAIESGFGGERVTLFTFKQGVVGFDAVADIAGAPQHMRAAAILIDHGRDFHFGGVAQRSMRGFETHGGALLNGTQIEGAAVFDLLGREAGGGEEFLEGAAQEVPHVFAGIGAEILDDGAVDGFGDEAVGGRDAKENLQIGGAVEDQLQAGFAFAQGGFGQFAFGDVEAVADDFEGVAGGIAQHAQLVAYPAVFAALSAKTIFVAVFADVGQMLEAGEDAGDVVRMQAVSPKLIVGQEFFALVTP